MRVALEEIKTEDMLRQERGWKLFMLLPRMLLHRPPRGGVVERGKLLKRFDQFNRRSVDQSRGGKPDMLPTGCSGSSTEITQR